MTDTETKTAGGPLTSEEVDLMAKLLAMQIKLANVEGQLSIALRWVETLTRTVGEGVAHV